MQVQVQRRETERQAEQRLASFAHISQTEAEEKWRTLNYASPDSEVATGIWEKLMKPTQQEGSLASMPCAAYLSTLTAGKAGLPCLKRKRVHGVMAKSVCTLVPDKYPLHEHFCKIGTHRIELLASPVKDCSAGKQLQLNAKLKLCGLGIKERLGCRCGTARESIIKS